MCLFLKLYYLLTLVYTFVVIYGKPKTNYCNVLFYSWFLVIMNSFSGTSCLPNVRIVTHATVSFVIGSRWEQCSSPQTCRFRTQTCVQIVHRSHILWVKYLSLRTWCAHLEKTLLRKLISHEPRSDTQPFTPRVCGRRYAVRACALSRHPNTHASHTR